MGFKAHFDSTASTGVSMKLWCGRHSSCFHSLDMSRCPPGLTRHCVHELKDKQATSPPCTIFPQLFEDSCVEERWVCHPYSYFGDCFCQAVEVCPLFCSLTFSSLYPSIILYHIQELHALGMLFTAFHAWRSSCLAGASWLSLGTESLVIPNKVREKSLHSKYLQCQQDHRNWRQAPLLPHQAPLEDSSKFKQIWIVHSKYMHLFKYYS